ncbi:tRNA lysidine(34) synthetase TilS [Natranaerofaba carboxydovora]|uniref:tRNA lysidine(34) synthetase TilS n=1 Tax=Natranaerofaba carboxydovora TaxID=2742683 RepID=UPI001F12CB4B|nr:tRNA lysidine(34) synthetase TilS [Natranaerofaba carboxydovora]UMZ75286.1 tRNA(Ile)-lysidine synthase [Natranaerofaba carboxydovora]
MKDEFLDQVKYVIEDLNLIPEKSKVIVAVSGGPDSVALLCVLNQLKKELNFSLHVAHLNHGFREETAKEDADFVKGLSNRLDVPCTIKKWNVKHYVKKKKVSPQQGARTLRYRFLARVAEKEGANLLAFGHNKNDQVETFFMRLLRGSSLEGLSGIPIKRKLEEEEVYNLNKNIHIIRPLLYVEREKIEKYLQNLNQSFKIDPTNEESLYLRNKLRIEILPQLEKINPNLKSLIFKTAEGLSVDSDYLMIQSNELYHKARLDSRKGLVRLNTAFLKDEHTALVSRVLKKAAKIASGKEIEKKHINYIQGVIYKKENQIILPGKIKVYLKKNVLTFVTLKNKLEQDYYEKKLNVPGITCFEPLDCCIKAEIKDKDRAITEEFIEKPQEAFLDYDKIDKGNIIVRTRLKGDEFYPLGMNHAKKLKDFFIDIKVSKEERDITPIVASKGEIVWVCPFRISERFRVTPETKRILHLKLVNKTGEEVYK